MDYEYREMGSADLERLREIDRSERITGTCAMEGDELVWRTVDRQDPGWHDGTGARSFGHYIDFCRGHLERGARALGCFTPDDVLVGIGLMTPDLEPGVAQLSFLHVSHDHRRQGIARELVERLTAWARAGGAAELYVSATPSQSAVSFYQGVGFSVTDQPDGALLELEPEDIHLRRRL